MTKKKRIQSRDRDAIMQSLRAGVVPRKGIQHIQVGRIKEVNALVHDIDCISDGGSTIRFIIGEYGSGKTFFLNLIRSIAMEKKCVTTQADLTPDRRLHANSGQSRLLYAELMRSISTRAKPDGGALSSIVERFITSALGLAKSTGTSPENVIHKKLENLTELVGGYDFAEVLSAYWKGYDTENDVLKSDALKWLKGEFITKTDARNALGVRTIINDSNFYNMLKLLGQFVKLAGYSGFLVCLDEMVNLYKLANTQARNSNYEQILSILNDSLQGISRGLGFLLGGTPEFLYDTRRGLYSYPALQSRLSENTFVRQGLVDFSGPVMRLTNLSPEDLYVLLSKLRYVFSYGDEKNFLIPDETLHVFLEHCHKRIGDAYFRTPRNTIVAFVNLLSILEQNPGISWKELLGDVAVTEDENPDLVPLPDPADIDKEQDSEGESLTSFKL